MTYRSYYDHYLIISDLQIPFEAEKSLEFCLYLKSWFKIPDENIYNVGDEVDQYFGGLWEKDPDAWHTPNSEIADAKRRLKAWYKAFPLMKIATSNHGMRWAKKARAAQIPSQMLRTYQEVLEAPAGWQWKDVWKVQAPKHSFLVKHGMEYGGMYAYRNAPFIEGMSVAFGHLHAHAGIARINTDGLNVWGMNTGSLIRVDDYAFQYGKYNRFKPTLSAGVVIQGGLTPLLMPYTFARYNARF